MQRLMQRLMILPLTKIHLQCAHQLVQFPVTACEVAIINEVQIDEVEFHIRVITSRV